MQFVFAVEELFGDRREHGVAPYAIEHFLVEVRPHQVTRTDADVPRELLVRDVEEIRTAEEDLIFSLPKELRQDATGRRDERALGGRGRA